MLYSCKRSDSHAWTPRLPWTPRTPSRISPVSVFPSTSSSRSWLWLPWMPCASRWCNCVDIYCAAYHFRVGFSPSSTCALLHPPSQLLMLRLHGQIDRSSTTFFTPLFLNRQDATESSGGDAQTFSNGDVIHHVLRHSVTTYDQNMRAA